MSDSRKSVEEVEGEDGIEEHQQKQKQKKRKKKKEKKRDDGYERKMRGAKNLILSPFRKFEKILNKRKKRPPPPPFPYSEDYGGKGCYFCISKPKVALDSPTRPDPGAKISTYHDFLRSLLERNDFYSPECNVHGPVSREQ